MWIVLSIRRASFNLQVSDILERMNADNPLATLVAALASVLFVALVCWPVAAEDNPFRQEVERRERLAQILCTETHVSFWRREGDHWQSETMRLDTIKSLSLYDDGMERYYPVLVTDFEWHQLHVDAHDAMRDCITSVSWWDRLLNRL